MSTLCQEEIVNIFFKNDQTLLNDLKTHRGGISHRLVRRLDAIRADNATRSHLKVFTPPQVQGLLEILVKCYINTADSIKVSRAVEKLWKPYLVNHEDYIGQCIEGHVMSILKSENSNCHQLANVSVLLEQNKSVQQIIHKHLDQVLSWLATQLSTLVKLSPLMLTPDQAKCLYASVKIILQLFQVCSSELGVYIWEDNECTVPGNQSVTVIVTSLIHILHRQGYRTDCVLLCGTTIALMLNCSRNEQTTMNAFHFLLYHVLCSESDFQLDHLKQSTEPGTGQQKFVYVELSKLTSSRLGSVSLIRGMVSCGREDILLSKAKHHNDETVLFYELFQYIAILCQGDITLHYQAFQICLLWYTRLTKISSSCESFNLNSKFTSTLESTLLLVMLNWDSPVEDVPEAMVDIFTCMMSVWERIKGEVPGFPDRILDILLTTQWYVKGKYRILAVLLKHVHAKKVLDCNPQIQVQLLRCLSTNYLASSATNVYKAFLQHTHRCKDTIDVWTASWLPTLMGGLLSDDSLQRYNTSLHWIPATFKLLPMTSTVIQDHLSTMMEDTNTPVCRMRLLHAWIIVAKTNRMQTGYTDLEHVTVREALCCSDEDVRSCAIALVCTTLKKAECISKVEVSLLMESLPYNIKIDSAPFRQHLGSDVRKLLVRLRDSCVTMLKSPTLIKEKLDCAIDFVDWLHRLCIEFLLPGACYQRRKGSLDFLHVVYESLIYSGESRQIKGFVPETAMNLLDFARSCGRWDFFSRVNTQSLLMCLLDGSDEIQKSAYLLLTRYYSMPLESNVEPPHRLCCHLLTEALRLCNSPKGHECQSGASLCKLVFQKYVFGHRVCFSIQRNPDTNSLDVATALNATDDVSMQFLTSVFTETKRSMIEADKNLVTASKHYPLHGLISAVTQCLTETCDLWLTPSVELLHLTQEMVNLCQQIIEKMLNIMAGVAGKEACPSFAEIGLAMESLLLENQTDYTDGTGLSPEYQYMLSWCWNNIKESCICLGGITRVSMMSMSPLSLSTIQSVSTTFHSVLTKCRHKGVIEGCRSAYIQFCSALFQSNCNDVLSVPVNSLSEVLSGLRRSSVGSSVTRRSAGLPIIIQAVLVSEKTMKQTSLLTCAVSSLFDICELPVNNDLGLTDLPQVHGLNILDSLFSDASLTVCLIGHTSRAVILVVRQFGSPSWAIRNAATRFFSTLVTRIFGQKKTHDNRLGNSVTYQEFTSYYPELPPFMLEILTEASEGDMQDISQIHSGLFPVLSLLSCLKPMYTKDGAVVRQLQQFYCLMHPFTGSPVYQLRHLVAAALVGMVTMQEMTSSLTSCLRDHVTPLNTSGSVCYNSLHGNLLYMYKLLDYIERREDVEELWMLLTHEIWLIPVNNGMVSSVYINILHKLLIDCPTVIVAEILEFVVIEHCTKGSKQNIGNSVFCEAAVEFLFCSYDRNGMCMYGLVDKLLTYTNTEARKACLEKLPVFLEKSEKNLRYNKMAISAILCSYLKKEDSRQFVCTILNLIGTLYQDLGTMHKEDFQCLTDWFAGKSYKELKSRDSVLVSVIPVQAILIKHRIEERSDNSIHNSKVLHEFCDVVRRFSEAVNECQRLSAVTALQIVGRPLLDLTERGNWFTSLLGATLTLIQDEDTDIRLEACKFVSQLQWEDKATQFSSFHSNVCFELFLQYLSDNFWQCSQCIGFLFSQLSSPVNLESLLSERFSSRYQQLFEQEDNSHFAEKIYNSFSIHAHLKVMLNKLLVRCGEETDILDRINDVVSVADLEGQLLFLKSVLIAVPSGALFNICTDNTVLSSICVFLLSCDIVSMVTKNQNIEESVEAVIQIDAFPSGLRQKLVAIHTEEVSNTS